MIRYTKDYAKAGNTALTDIKVRKLSNIEAVLSTEMVRNLDEKNSIRDSFK